MAKHDDKHKVPDQIVIDTEVLTDEPADFGGEGTATAKIHNAVIAGIARLAALEVPGVNDLSSGFAEKFATAFGAKKTMERGVKVEVDGDFVSLEIHIIVNYGVRIPQVSWQVQSEVRRAIEQMTGKTVHDVQVIVQGVRKSSGMTTRTSERST